MAEINTDAQYLKRLTKDFFNRHPIKKFSAAGILYYTLVMPELLDAFEELLPQIDAMAADEAFSPPDYSEQIAEVEREEDTERLLRMLRRGQPPHVVNRLIQKLLAREEEVLSEVQRMLLKAFKDETIENCARFLAKCEADPTNWIMEHFQEVREPYARSALCMVLGFHATPAAIPFLIQQMERFGKEFPDKSFEQGPIIALCEIRERFGRN